MGERKTFVMSQEQYDELLDHMKPVPMIMLQCGNPPSQQENANAAWKRLGLVMGFKYMTVRPGGTKLAFTAEVSDDQG